MSDTKEKEIVRAVKRLAVDTPCPDGTRRKTIGLTDSIAVSRDYAISRRSVEITALYAGIIPARYLRNAGTLGVEGQSALLESRVAVIGLGGLGGTIAKNLARVGVGVLILIDGDAFSEDNLNRQEFSSEGAIGRPKAEVAAEEIAGINGAVEVTALAKMVDTDDLVRILPGCGVVVDALDSIPARFALSDAASIAGVPLVHGSVAGFVGQVATIMPSAGGFGAIFGDRDNLPQKGVEIRLGNLPGIVGTVANLQTVEVIKILTGIGRPISGRLLFMDLENSTFDFFDV